MRGWGVAVNHPPKHTASDYLNKIWHMPHSLMPAYDKWSGNLITHAAPCGTYLNISPCSSFIISAFKALIAFLLSHSILPLIDVKKHICKLFLSVGSRNKPPQSYQRVLECMSGDVEFQMLLINCISYLMGQYNMNILLSREREEIYAVSIHFTLHFTFGFQGSVTCIHTCLETKPHTYTCS